MKELRLYPAAGQDYIPQEEVCRAVAEAFADLQGSGKKVLLLVPDYTRYHSGAGFLAGTIFHTLSGCHVDLLECLGTHVPMTRAECADMYGDIPFERFIPHNWRTDVVKLGRDHTPVRKVFDYALEHFLADLPLSFLLTVTTAPGGDIHTHGVFLGTDRSYFEDAVALTQEKNLILMDQPIRKAVVYLNPAEFHSTWLGNKAVYRTRMAIADGGELLILAPGIEKFGEDPQVDQPIRKYGYCGRENVIQLAKTQQDLRENLSAAAHLIHGSSDGRFSITYCTEKVTKEEVEGVCFGYLPYREAAGRYDPNALTDGWHTLPDGETFFYISNPALGLWADRDKFRR